MDIEKTIHKLCKDFPEHQLKNLEIIYQPIKRKWFVGLCSNIMINFSQGYEYIEEDADLVTAFNRLRFRNGMNIIKLRGINGI
jgi:hypothetical protein